MHLKLNRQFDFVTCVGSETQPTKVAGTLRRAVRLSAFNGILGGRHMECAYYFDFCRLCLARCPGALAKQTWRTNSLFDSQEIKVDYGFFTKQVHVERESTR